MQTEMTDEQKIEATIARLDGIPVYMKCPYGDLVNHLGDRKCGPQQYKRRFASVQHGKIESIVYPCIKHVKKYAEAIYGQFSGWTEL